MLKFGAEQKVFHIGDVTIGGRLGEYPTVMIGSIFYQGHKIVSDPEKGVFDKAKAHDLLAREEEVSATTGNPRMIDVVADSTTALIKYIEFVATECDDPILVDSPLASVRMATVRHFAQTELVPRLVYNSIDEHNTPEELACIAEAGVKSAIVLAFSASVLRPKMRLRCLEERLFADAVTAGVENLLVDPGVLDVPSVSWAADICYRIKNVYGLPAGCAPANALWQWKSNRQLVSPVFEACGATVYGLPVSWGADFLLYGPMGVATWAYPAVAAIDAMLGYEASLEKIRVDQSHPLYQLF